MRCQNTNVVLLFLSNLQIYDFFAKKRNENSDVLINCFFV